MSARMAGSPLVTWKIDRFSGGLNEGAVSRPNETPRCRNVIARSNELLEKRGGQARLNLQPLPGPLNGLHAFYMGPTRLLLAASGGRAWQYNPAARLFSEIKNGLSDSAPVQFATCPDYAVAFDGVTVPWKTDGVTITDLENAPSDGYVAEIYAAKVFTVPKYDPSMLRFSQADDPEDWPIIHQWPVEDRDGDVVTALRTFHAQDHLAVFKRKKVFALMGQDMDNFQLSEARAEPGAVGPNAVVEHGGLLYYISEEGICAYNGLKSVNLSRMKLKNTWATVNGSVIERSCAGKWNGLLWFGVPTGSSAYPDLVIVYDHSTGAFWPMSGISPSSFASWNDGIGDVFVAGGGAEGYVIQLETGTTDFEAGIDAYWESPVLGTDNAEARKKLYRAYVANEPDTSGAVLFAYAVGGQRERATPIALEEIRDDDDLLDRYDFPAGAYAHYVQVKLSHSSTSDLMRVRSISIDHEIQVR